MTPSNTELINDVRTLELEVRKLELEKRIAQLKAEPFIDEDCVGCAGPCMVVDVAAKLQEKFDEYKEAVRLERIEHVAVLQAVNQRHHVEINKLQAENIEDLKEQYDLAKDELNKLKHQLNICRGSGTAHNIHIAGLKKTIDEGDRMLEKYGDKITCLRKMHGGVVGRVHARVADIEGLKKELSTCKQNEDDCKGKFVEQAQLNGVLLWQIGDLKTELSVRKQDSEVLMKVVEIVRQWDAEHTGVYPNLYQLNKLYDCLVDYLDAPEELDVDGHQDVSVTVALLELS